MKVKIAAVIFLAFGFSLGASDWRGIAHIVSVPLIEGGGIYTSVKYLQDSESPNTKAAAITNISLLGVNAVMGGLSMFGPEDLHGKLRPWHRALGIVITGAALWLSISGGMDHHVDNLDRNITYGYTALTAVPVIMFSF